VQAGAPAIFGPFCFVSDLRSGAMSGGSPEQALLSAGAAQMAQFYDLTCGTPAGMTDAKLPDAQSGSEKAYNHALVGNAGANLVYEAGGMMASLLGFSMEQLVIDDEIIGATQRTIRGIEVNDETLSLHWLRSRCLGDGKAPNLPAEPRLAPIISDRSSLGQWQVEGRQNVLQRARARLNDILGSHFPTHIPRAVDDAIRRRFPVSLDSAHMQRP
jgi:trimethylamine--corrinoid protein Co-methyltransferase